MAEYGSYLYITISIDLNHNFACSSSEVTPLHWKGNLASFVHAQNLIIYVQYCRCCQSISANLIVLTDHQSIGSCFKYYMGWWNSYVFCVLISQNWEMAFLMGKPLNKEPHTEHQSNTWEKSVLWNSSLWLPTKPMHRRVHGRCATFMNITKH